MNRRGFFSAIAAVAATATMDPERLLWIPGKKLISIPAPPVISVTARDIISQAYRYLGVMSMTSPEAQTHAFNRLNCLLERWGAEPMALPPHIPERILANALSFELAVDLGSKYSWFKAYPQAKVLPA